MHAVNVRHEQGQMPGKLGSNTHTKREKLGKTIESQRAGKDVEFHSARKSGQMGWSLGIATAQLRNFAAAVVPIYKCVITAPLPALVILLIEI